LDGACDVDKLVAHVDKIGQKSVAMTEPWEHLWGGAFFSMRRRRRGSSRSWGVSFISARRRIIGLRAMAISTTICWCWRENQEGYKNLVRLTSEAALHGFYRKPRVSKNFLAKHTKGLIAFSGCLAGEVSQHIMDGAYDRAKATAGQFEEMFGKGNFFLEVQDHRLTPDKAVVDAMFRMEKDLGIPLIATNDSHYIEDQDSRAHEILLCVQTNGSMNDPKRFKFDSEEFYIKTADEMARMFPDHPEVLSRTMQFPERCNLKLSKVENPFPEFPVRRE